MRGRMRCTERCDGNPSENLGYDRAKVGKMLPVYVLRQAAMAKDRIKFSLRASLILRMIDHCQEKRGQRRFSLTEVW